MFNVLLKTSLAFERFWTVGVCTVADILPLIISDKSDGSIWILEGEHSLTIHLMMISLAPSVKGCITELARMHAWEDTKLGLGWVVMVVSSQQDNLFVFGYVIGSCDGDHQSF